MRVTQREEAICSACASACATRSHVASTEMSRNCPSSRQRNHVSQISTEPGSRNGDGLSFSSMVIKRIGPAEGRRPQYRCAAFPAVEEDQLRVVRPPIVTNRYDPLQARRTAEHD